MATDEERLLDAVGKAGGTAGNLAVMKTLGWDKEKYLRVRGPLVESGKLALGRGKGGSIRSVNAEREELLRHVPPDGSPTGNITLKEKLGWKEDRYWRVRNELVDEGALVVGGGKGGSVRRVIDAGVIDEAVAEAAAAPTGERALYEPIKKVLETDWAKSEGLTEWCVEVTAQQGRRNTGGRWTRPDLTVVSCRRYTLVPGPAFDVWTFEVKPIDAWDIVGVHEAAAHASAATRSYAFFHVNAKLTPDETESLDRCLREAQTLGVGLITATDVAKFATWEILAEPARKHYDPTTVEEFLKTQLSEEAKAKVVSWLKKP